MRAARRLQSGAYAGARYFDGSIARLYARLDEVPSRRGERGCSLGRHPPLNDDERQRPTTRGSTRRPLVVSNDLVRRKRRRSPPPERQSHHSTTRGATCDEDRAAVGETLDALRLPALDGDSKGMDDGEDLQALSALLNA